MPDVSTPTPNKAKKFLAYGAVLAGLFIVVTFVWGAMGYSQQSLGLSGSIMAPSAPSYDSVASNGAYGFEDEGARRMISADKTSDAVGNYAMEEAMMPSPIPGGGEAPAGDAKIIKNADLTLLVVDVNLTAVAIEKLRTVLGGQPGNANFSESTYGKSGDITFWVPSDKFDFALAEVKKLALKVSNERVSVSDVSAQFVDIQARLKNLRSTEAQYVEIMKRSGTINEVLSVTQVLSQTRAQIEQLQGQLNYLSRQVALSSIHVSISQEVRPGEAKDEWRPLSVVKAATKETLKDFTRFIDMMLIMLVMLPMFLLKIVFYGTIFWLVWHFGRIFYRRLKNSYLPPLSK